MEIIQDDSFNYDGYEVVRGEFSHLHEPCITFNNFKVYMNTACIKKLPETDYVQILVNQEKRSWLCALVLKNPKIPSAGAAPLRNAPQSKSHAGYSMEKLRN